MTRVGDASNQEFTTIESHYLKAFTDLAADVKSRKIDYTENGIAKPSSAQTRKYVQSIQTFATYSRERLLNILKNIFDYSGTSYLSNENGPEFNRFRDISIKIMHSINTGENKDFNSSGIMAEFFWDSAKTSPLKEGEGKQNFIVGIQFFTQILEKKNQIFKSDLQFLLNHLEENGYYEIIVEGIGGHDLLRDLANFSHEAKDLETLSRRLHIDKIDSFMAKLTKIMKSLLLIEHYAQPISTDTESYVSELEKKIIQRMAATGESSKSLQLNRLKNLPWGPENHVRDPEIITNVIDKLAQNGVVSLTGWGGVGKTALAQKIIIEEEENYDHIIQNTLKIASGQSTFVPTEDGPRFVDTTTEITGMESLHRRNRITGSARELFTKIITITQGPLGFEDSNLGDMELMNMALSVLQENRFLVLIDNYEDIETPQKGQITLSPAVAAEKKLYTEFLNKWADIYSHALSLTLKNKGEHLKSRLIITSRGSGAMVKATIPVPWLGIEETLKLYRSSLINRRRGGSVNEANSKKFNITQKTLDQWTTIENTDARTAFTGWNTKNFKSDKKEDDSKFKGHPMLIRQAAYIYDGEEYGFIESINKMNPEGKEAREITEYCTSKCLEVLSTEQQKVMHYIANLPRGKYFDTSDLIRVAKFDEDPNEHAYKASEFCNEMQSRGFLYKSRTQEDRFAMIIGIKLQIQATQDYNTWKAKHGNEIRDDTDIDLQEDSFEFDENMRWSDFSHTIKWIHDFCESKAVTPDLLDRWGKMISALGETIPQVRERIKKMPRGPLYSLYGYLCGAELKKIPALLPKSAKIFINLSRKSATSATGDGAKMARLGDQEKKVIQNNRKIDKLFSTSNTHVSLFTWFRYLSLEMLKRMTSVEFRQPPEFILKTVEKNLIILEELNRIIDGASSLSKEISTEYISYIQSAIIQAESADGSDWENVESKENLIQNILHRICKLWGFVPLERAEKDKIFSTKSSNFPQTNSHYANILNIYSDQIENSTSAELGGLIYWASLIWLHNNSLRTSANFDQTEKNALKLLSIFEEHGQKTVSLFMNKHYFSNWQKRILASRQKFILTLQDIEKARIGRTFQYGLNGKFIELKPNFRPARPNLILKYLPASNYSEESLNTFEKLIYNIRNVEFIPKYSGITATIYLEPIIYENKPLTMTTLLEQDGLKLIGLDSLGEDIQSIIDEYSLLKEQVSWKDFLISLEKHVEINLTKLMNDLCGKTNFESQLKFFFEIAPKFTKGQNFFVQYPEKNMSNIPFVQDSAFTLRQRFGYQIMFPSQDQQIYLPRMGVKQIERNFRKTRKPVKSGLGLPKNPGLTAYFIREFFQFSQQRPRLTYLQIVEHFIKNSPPELFEFEEKSVSDVAEDFVYNLAYLSKGDAKRLGRKESFIVPWHIFESITTTPWILAVNVKRWVLRFAIPRNNELTETVNFNEGVVKQYFKDVINS